MIPPQELKKNKFAKVMKGYEPAEVDEHISFLTEKYSELYARCDRYEKKLQLVAERIGEIKSEEEAIHKLAISNQKHCDMLLDEAQKKASEIVTNANIRAEKILKNAEDNAREVYGRVTEKAEEQLRITEEKSNSLVMSARKRCADVLSGFKKEINAQSDALKKLKEFSDDFSESLRASYKEHLRILGEFKTPEINLDEFAPSALLESLMFDIKEDAVNIARRLPDIDYDYASELKKLDFDPDYDASGAHDEYQPEPESEYEGGFEAQENIQYDPAVPIADDDDDDVMVYSGRDSLRSTQGVTQEEEPRYTDQSDEYDEEEPIATFDSEDFKGYDSGEDEYSADDGDAYRSSVYDDDDDGGNGEYEESFEKEKKGLFGIFGKKKNKKEKRKRDDDIEDYEGDSEAFDIFDELDDDDV